MARVICTRVNASEEINGVKFEPHHDGMISEVIDEVQAEYFLCVGGYKLAEVLDFSLVELSSPVSSEEVIDGSLFNYENVDSNEEQTQDEIVKHKKTKIAK